MSTIQYPPEIVSAKNKLEKFDRTDGYEKLEHIKEFSKGIEELLEYELNSPKSPFTVKIASLKRAHARRLLFFIRWLNLNNINIDINSFYYLFDLIRYKLKGDIEYILDNSKELSGVVQYFFRSNSHISKQLVSELEWSIKSKKYKERNSI